MHSAFFVTGLDREGEGIFCLCLIVLTYSFLMKMKNLRFQKWSIEENVDV